MCESQPSAGVAAFNPLGLKAATHIWPFLPFDKQCLIFGYILMLFLCGRISLPFPHHSVDLLMNSPAPDCPQFEMASRWFR